MEEDTTKLETELQTAEFTKKDIGRLFIYFLMIVLIVLIGSVVYSMHISNLNNNLLMEKIILHQNETNIRQIGIEKDIKDIKAILNKPEEIKEAVAQIKKSREKREDKLP